MKIFVTAKPNAKQELIKQVDKTHFIVSVKEPPIQGRANHAILKLLSEYFKIPLSSVSLVSGYTFKQKVIDIEI